MKSLSGQNLNLLQLSRKKLPLLKLMFSPLKKLLHFLNVPRTNLGSTGAAVNKTVKNLYSFGSCVLVKTDHFPGLSRKALLRGLHL